MYDFSYSFMSKPVHPVSVPSLLFCKFQVSQIIILVSKEQKYFIPHSPEHKKPRNQTEEKIWHPVGIEPRTSVRSVVNNQTTEAVKINQNCVSQFLVTLNLTIGNDLLVEGRFIILFMYVRLYGHHSTVITLTCKFVPNMQSKDNVTAV